MSSYAATATVVGTVVSQGQPLAGQKNRSSQNFPNFNLPSGVQQLRWNVELLGPGTLSNLRFNVMQDNSLSRDPVLLTGVAAGQVEPVSTPEGTFVAGGKYYIANPTDASTGHSFGTSFQVTVETA